jgi:hypothetical protein
MSNCTRYLGLDVHAETITAAIADPARRNGFMDSASGIPRSLSWTFTGSVPRRCR